MQRLTVFSILIVLTSLLIFGELAMSSYMKAQLQVAKQGLNSILQWDSKEEIAETSTVESPEITLSSEQEEDNTPSLDLSVDISTEIGLSPRMNESFLQIAGFTSPVLKETLFYGMIFQWIQFSDQNRENIRQWNMFSGPEYIGSFVELMHKDANESLQSYILIKKRAEASDQEGAVNETMSYGEASFYFNHSLKVNTVHLVIRQGDRVYVLEYAKDYHEKMKLLLQALLMP